MGKAAGFSNLAGKIKERIHEQKTVYSDRTSTKEQLKFQLASKNRSFCLV
ncbi:MAG: hypothetical protein LLF95_10260 [Bacteroidales bacterium]|nr:hypothetical protein [Bacteroidales bacterium]